VGQTLIVALVVVAAFAYVGRRVWAALRPKAVAGPGCGDGCGCGPGGGARDWAES
jgi:hypothetical protein